MPDRVLLLSIPGLRKQDLAGMPTLAALAHLAAGYRDERVAAALHEWLTPLASTFPHGIVCHVPFAHHMGMLEIVMNRRNDAQMSFKKAEAMAVDAGAPLLATETRLAWAAICDGRQRDELLEQAATVIEETGARGLVS